MERRSDNIRNKMKNKMQRRKKWYQVILPISLCIFLCVSYLLNHPAIAATVAADDELGVNLPEEVVKSYEENKSASKDAEETVSDEDISDSEGGESAESEDKVKDAEKAEGEKEDSEGKDSSEKDSEETEEEDSEEKSKDEQKENSDSKEDKDKKHLDFEDEKTDVEIKEITLTAHYETENGKSLKDDGEISVEKSFETEKAAAVIDNYEFLRAEINGTEVTEIKYTELDEESADDAEEDEKTEDVEEDADHNGKKSEDVEEGNKGKNSEDSAVDTQKESKADDGDKDETQYFYPFSYVTADGEEISLTEDTDIYFLYKGTGEKEVYEYEDSYVSVTAVLEDASAIPDDAELVVNHITEDSDAETFQAYLDALNAKAESVIPAEEQENEDEMADEDVYNESTQEESTDGDQKISSNQVLLYDISFLQDGEEVEPESGKVQVTVQFKKRQLSQELEAEDADDISVIHMPLTENGKEKQSAEETISADDIQVDVVEKEDASLGETEEIVYSLESFSVSAYVTRNTEGWSGYAIKGFISDRDAERIGRGGNFYLDGDTWTDHKITVSGDLNLNLNGYKFIYSGDDTLFTVQNGKSLSIQDSSAKASKLNPVSAIQTTTAEVRAGADTAQIATVNQSTSITIAKGNNGNGNGQGPRDTFNYDSKLTYYVTESAKSDIGTTETRQEYQISFGSNDKVGAIVATRRNNGGQNPKGIIKVNGGGTFTLDGGILSGQIEQWDAHIIQNEGDVIIKEGFICGGKNNTFGAGIYSNGKVELNGGVIAGNQSVNTNGDATGGAGIYLQGANSKLDMTGGIVSGNRSYSVHPYTRYGAGVLAIDGTTVTMSGGYVTNNRQDSKSDADGNGRFYSGGGGIHLANANMEMTGGYVTGNYARDTAGGIKVGSALWWSSYHIDGKPANMTMTGGVVAGNYAAYGEGGGIRYSQGSNGYINCRQDGDSINHVQTSKIYITNNYDGAPADWAGGGIFVEQAAHLYAYNTLITNNEARGYGGGVATCPTGNSYIVKVDGTAIYDNISKGDGDEDNSTKGISTAPGYDPEIFTNKAANYYKDYFSIGYESQNGDYASVVMDSMLGGGHANWSGRSNGHEITIPKDGAELVQTFCALKSDPLPTDKANAVNAAEAIISGNYSYFHGGGIMTNGHLFLGNTTTQIVVGPSVSFHGNKAVIDLDDQAVEMNMQDKFTFDLMKQLPTYDNKHGRWNYSFDADNMTSESTEANGEFTIHTDASNYSREYYLVERPGMDGQYRYDSSYYHVIITVKEESKTVGGITIVNYSSQDVKVKKGVLGSNGMHNEEDYDFYLDKSVGNLLQVDLAKDSSGKDKADHTFTNLKVTSYVLPSTGGTGTNGYIACGFGLMLMAGFGLTRKRRR